MRAGSVTVFFLCLTVGYLSWVQIEGIRSVWLGAAHSFSHPNSVRALLSFPRFLYFAVPAALACFTLLKDLIIDPATSKWVNWATVGVLLILYLVLVVMTSRWTEGMGPDALY